MNAPQTDILISRIIDGTATPEDWAQLDQIASDEPQVLQDLSAAMRQDAELRNFVRDAVAVADDIDIDTDRVIVRVDEDQWTTVPSRPAEPRRSAIMALVTWTGWTAAAAIAMTWIASLMYGDLPTRNLIIPDSTTGSDDTLASGQPAGPTGNGTAGVLPAAYDEAINHTLELGKQQNRIIEELPVVMLKQRIHGDGRVEIFYLRRFVERVNVDGMLEFKMDSSGQPRVVPVAPEGQTNEY